MPIWILLPVAIYGLLGWFFAESYIALKREPNKLTTPKRPWPLHLLWLVFSTACLLPIGSPTALLPPACREERTYLYGTWIIWLGILWGFCEIYIQAKYKLKPMAPARIRPQQATLIAWLGVGSFVVTLMTFPGLCGTPSL
jgi:hypothetical protein